jgi:hypothetical protein
MERKKKKKKKNHHCGQLTTPRKSDDFRRKKVMMNEKANGVHTTATQKKENGNAWERASDAGEITDALPAVHHEGIRRLL